MLLRRRFMLAAVAAVAVAAAVPAAATGTAAPAASAPTGHGAARPLPGLRVPAVSLDHRLSPATLRADSVTSLNWSGYVVQPRRPVTAVNADYVQPAYGVAPPGLAVVWTGIGGFGSDDLIQAGTAAMPPGGLFGPQYYAWFEVLPDAMMQIAGCAGDRNCTVNPGDRISVGIRQVSGTRWLISLRDAGRWTWSRVVSYASSRSSAEWVVEAPSAASVQTTLDAVGRVVFSGANTYVSGGRRTSIGGSATPTAVLLAGGLEATPSALTRSGTAFAVCAYALSCAAP